MVSERLVEEAAKAMLMVTQEGVSVEYAWSVQFDEVREELIAQARAALAVFEAAQAPTGDEREELIGLQLASYSKRMSDGYTSSIIRSNEEAAEIVLDAGFRLPVQGEPTDARWIDEIETKALAQVASNARMVEIGEGVGGLGVRHPRMFEDLLAWQDASENDHADTVLTLIARVREEQQKRAEAEAVIARIEQLCAETDVDTTEATQAWLVENIGAVLASYKTTNDENGEGR